MLPILLEHAGSGVLADDPWSRALSWWMRLRGHGWPSVTEMIL